MKTFQTLSRFDKIISYVLPQHYEELCPDRWWLLSVEIIVPPKFVEDKR